MMWARPFVTHCRRSARQKSRCLRDNDTLGAAIADRSLCSDTESPKPGVVHADIIAARLRPGHRLVR
jgi:hypothetical protein